MAGRHEALLLEMSQRLTHRPPADAEACRQLGLAQVVPGAVLARRDRCAQRLQGALAERAAVQVCRDSTVNRSSFVRASITDNC